MKRIHSLLHLAVGDRHPGMLPQMLDPGLGDERLEEPARIRWIAPDARTQGAITPPLKQYSLHHSDKLIGSLWVNQILDDHQNRTVVRPRSAHNHRVGPMCR